MQRVRLTLEYDGTEFAGWQIQPGQRTVQGVLERALKRLLFSEERIVAYASGRTDSGVHAEGQVVAFDDPRDLPLIAFREGLLPYLPDDLAVMDAAIVAPDFDPRRDATGKRYVYRIWNGALKRPLMRNLRWRCADPLDPKAMQEAARHLVGVHDFKSFQAARCDANTTVRHLSRVEVTGTTGGEFEVVVEGNGFMRHMVRNLVGTLVEVGEGRRTPESLPELLEARDRSLAGRTAPAQGLTLEAVYYGARREKDGSEEA